MKSATPAPDPDSYVASLRGWQRACVENLRAPVRSACEVEERVKWGHLVYLSNGPVLLIRAERERVLFGFWRGKRLRTIEKGLRPGGKYEMATLELTETSPIGSAVVRRLAKAAVALNKTLGDPTHVVTKGAPKDAAQCWSGPREAKVFLWVSAGATRAFGSGNQPVKLMRRLCGLMALLVVGAAAHGQVFPEPRTIRINARVHVLLGPIQHANRVNQGYMINSTVIVGDKGVILIDSGGSHEVGRHIAASVRRITDKPVTHVVNTHPHGDHYLGNVVFEGATFISSEMCRKMVLENGHEWLEIMERDIGRRLAGTKPLAAEVTYPEGTRAETFIHGVRIVFWVPRGSHTIGDLLVHLPDDKVLVAGDVLVSRVVPTLQDGFLKNWIQTLDEIQAFDVTHFVPGHGDLMSVDDVATMRGAMAKFHAGVKEGFRNGQSEGKIRKSLDLSLWDKLERSYVIGRNINRAYLEIEADSFNE